MDGALPFGKVQCGQMSLIVVQAAKLQPRVCNRARQLQDALTIVLAHAGAIHPRIDIDEDADTSATPYVKLVEAFHQRRDARVRILVSDLTHAPRVCAHYRK